MYGQFTQTIWMMSRLHPRTLNHFSHLTISNSSFSEFLSWNPPIWLGTLHFGTPGSGWRKSLASLLQFLRFSLSPCLLPFFQITFPEACSFMAQLSSPDSSIWAWWEQTWSHRREGGTVALLQLPGLPESTSLPSEHTSARADEGGRKKREEGVESRQWDSWITTLWPTSFRSALNSSI